MHARFGHAAYQQGQVASADPLRIVVLLYEGAIRFVAQAKDRWSDPAARGTALGRAHRIVSELLTALDYEQGGEIARNLDGLYHYVLDEITRANVEANPKGLDSVLHVLRELLSGWATIEREGRAQGSAPAQSADTRGAQVR